MELPSTTTNRLHKTIVMRGFIRLLFVLSLHNFPGKLCYAADAVTEATETSETTGEPKAGESSSTTTPSNSTTADEGGPLVDLLGSKLLQLVMIDEKQAKVQPLSTTDALRNKEVVGIYFSADWCPACVQFTPELVQFHKKVNQRRKDRFAIVWVSRCRDINAYSQYMASIPDFHALPPEEAMGPRGEQLMRKYGVKGIPSLILLDAETGSIITKEGRNKVPQDKAGIGFPWRNPLVQLYMTIVPRMVRRKIMEQVHVAKDKVVAKAKQIFQFKKPTNSKMTAQA